MLLLLLLFVLFIFFKIPKIDNQLFNFLIYFVHFVFIIALKYILKLFLILFSWSFHIFERQNQSFRKIIFFFFFFKRTRSNLGDQSHPIFKGICTFLSISLEIQMRLVLYSFLNQIYFQFLLIYLLFVFFFLKI